LTLIPQRLINSYALSLHEPLSLFTI
jgi:hypothetical protein